LDLPELAWTLDTHVLVYATEAEAPAEKQRITKQLLTRLVSAPQACLVGQVVGEFLSVGLRKKAMSHAQAFIKGNATL